MAHQTPSGEPHSNSTQTPPPHVDDLVRVFNTALVTSRLETGRSYTQEMLDLVQTPAFRSLLGAIRTHAKQAGIPERQAAEQMISAFRRMDNLWAEYLIQEGVQRLKTPASNA